VPAIPSLVRGAVHRLVRETQRRCFDPPSFGRQRRAALVADVGRTQLLPRREAAAFTTIHRFLVMNELTFLPRSFGQRSSFSTFGAQS